MLCEALTTTAWSPPLTLPESKAILPLPVLPTAKDVFPAPAGALIRESLPFLPACVTS